MLREESVIDTYRIIKPIGEGGTASVYLACRTDDPKVEVALKVLHAHYDPHMLARFKRERRLLAQLQHRYIASFYDFGITEEGLPWMAMQRITGVPIMRWVHQHSPDLSQRLDLMLKICEAVSYAHSQFILHRDLKPSNILVTPDGNPCLLDFGIAALLNPESGEQDQVTRIEDQSMTPEYASPEQVLAKPLSAASDVYSLGVIFFEMLTSRRPYYFETRSPLEIARIICERNIHRPSTLVRREEPEQAIAFRHLKGDLDSILLKALAKEPQGRYGSVLELKNDLRAWKSGRPVMAQSRSWFYRPGKFIRRNIGFVSFAAIFVMTLIGFSYAMWHQRNLTALERDRALQKQRSAEKVTDFLGSLFDPNILVPNESEITRTEIIARATAFLETVEEDSVRSRILSTLGTTNHSLGNYNLALQYLEEAITLFNPQEDKSKIQRAKIALAECYFEEGDYAKAIQSMSEALQPDLNPDPSIRAQGLALMGKYYWKDGHYDRALEIFDESKALFGELNPMERQQTAFVVDNNYALVLMERGRMKEAAQLFERGIERAQVMSERNKFEVRVMTFNLGLCYQALGDLEKARQGYEACLKTIDTYRGKDFIERAYPLLRLADLATYAKDYDKAYDLTRQAYNLRVAKLSEDNPELISSMLAMARTLALKGDKEAAMSLNTKALELNAKHLPKDHVLSVRHQVNGLKILLTLNQQPLARNLAKSILENMGEINPTNQNHLIALSLYGRLSVYLDPDLAKAQTTKVLDIIPPQLESLEFSAGLVLNHAVVAMETGNYTALKPLLEKDWEEPINYLWKAEGFALCGVYHAWAGNQEEARTAFEFALHNIEGSNELYYREQISHLIQKGFELMEKPREGQNLLKRL